MGEWRHKPTHYLPRHQNYLFSLTPLPLYCLENCSFAHWRREWEVLVSVRCLWCTEMYVPVWNCITILRSSVHPVASNEPWQQLLALHTLDQRPLTWGTKTSYINHNEAQEPLEPWTSSDNHIHEDSSSNRGAGMRQNNLNHIINRSEPH
jgi:hypothetical protein